ncbi:hypothetical protein [Methanoregula sp.]|uniref:hypothetical protein n=1 Tax=Methanoregula sp. TaxID=2052170 RepID=UPI000CBA7A1D|nr:hypothetical protein [Methanoregula sp.]PKG31656.1 MAG: hypothetical protein CW742_12255 [Methanoregula sp.]
MLSAREEAADLKKNPLPPEPDCSTCLHCCIPEAECDLRDEEDNKDRCEYAPDADHDETLPLLEQAYRLQALILQKEEVLKKYRARFDKVMDQVLASKIENQGIYSLIDKPRKVRVPSVEKFKERFSEEYSTLKKEEYAAKLQKLDDLLKSDLTSIPVKRAEELIGKVKLNEISEEKVYHAYKVVSAEDNHAGL